MFPDSDFVSRPIPLLAAAAVALSGFQPRLTAEELPESWVNPPPADNSDWTPEKREFVTPEAAPLVSMGEDGELVYNPYTERGDRILDFSFCGYEKSNLPISTIAVVETLSPPEGEWTQEGNMRYPVGPDSYELIQGALNRAAEREPDILGFRGAVLLQEGLWHLREGLRIPSGVVLRGEGQGPEGTTLIFTMPDGGSTGIRLDGGGSATTSRVWLSGVVTEEPHPEKARNYVFTLDDGYRFGLRTPRERFGFKLADYLNQRIALRFTVDVIVEGPSRSVVLGKTFPWEVKTLEPGEAAMTGDPDLILPGQTDDGITANSNWPQVAISDDYVPSGSFQLTVADASMFAPGDSLQVIKTTNQEWIDVLGLGERLRHIRGGREGAGKRPWGPQTYGHPREIVAVNGNTITLDVPLPQSIQKEHGGGYVQKTNPPTMASYCGLEYLNVVSNYDTTVRDQSKSSNFKNLKNGVTVNAMNSWVRNCTVMHTWLGAVSANGARYSTIRDCKSLEPVGPKRGGRRYPFGNNGGVGVLFYNCYSEDGRHDFVVGARTEGPNAYVECYTSEGGNAEPHHRWGVGILFDNIAMPNGGNCAAINRGDSGSGHGWAGANVVFWNCNAPNITVFDPETVGENNFAIGYTGPLLNEFNTGGLWYANTRSGYWGTPQEGRYYGYPAMGSGYIESPSAPVEPKSLFMQQLIDRIGEERALQVME